jgi:hypothetical protein
VRFILARDLRIGDTLGTQHDGEPAIIKALHELCAHRPGPHVHAVTTLEHRCLPFTQAVAR